MANALFDSGRDGFLNGQFNWSSDSFKVILLSSQYSVDLINHTTTASVGGTVAISGVMITITPGKGVADANDLTISGVAGTTVTQYIIFHDSSKKLVAYFDTSTNLPVVPNGGNITLQWSNTNDRIFKL
jgi:hypothetical protein